MNEDERTADLARSTDQVHDRPKLVRGWDKLPRIGHKYGPLWLRHDYFARREARDG